MKKKSKIVEKIESQMKEGLYLGASLALFEEGAWTEYYLGQSEDGVATTPGLRYDIASVSKVVGVGTLLIPLIASGQLELERPFQAYYPAFHDEGVTLGQLVTHTSGIDPYIEGRDELTQAELKAAIEQIGVTKDTSFHYTDLNLILLGFLLEDYYHRTLDVLFYEKIFQPWSMTETSFGPLERAVPTVRGEQTGMVHDPKARVLQEHCGSAGLFSSLKDLEIFLEHYLTEDFGIDLERNISSDKPRSIVWNLDGDWLDHTGYTGPFIMVNRKRQQAAIFLTNRTYHEDNRPLWIEKRRELRDVIKNSFR